MIKHSYLLLILTLGVATLIGFKANAQEFADKSYYLVDSLVLEDFSEQDREVMEKYLSEFHATDDDTVKVGAIYKLISEITSSDWLKFNEVLCHISKQELEKDLTPEEERFHHIMLSTALSNRAYMYAIEGETDLAIEKDEEALNLSFQISDTLGIARGLNNLGVTYGERGDFTKAIAYYNESLKIGQKLYTLAERASILNNLGLMYRRMGNIKAAIDRLYESLILYDFLDMKEDVVLRVNSLGGIYREQGDYNKAFQYHFKALELSEEIGSEVGKAASFNSLGICYKLIGQFSTAEKYHKSSLEINEAINNTKGIIYDKKHLGELYTKMGKYKESQHMLTESLDAAIASNYQLAVVQLKNTLSKAYLLSGEIQKAMAHVNESLDLAEEIGLPKFERDALLQLSECYKYSGESDKGWEVYTQYVILNDSIENIGIENKALIEETDYLLSVKDKEVALIDQEADLLRERGILKDYLLFGILGFIALIIIAGIIGYRIVKKRKVNNENLQDRKLAFQAKKNQELPTEDVDLKRISKILLFELTDLNADLSNPLSQREFNVLEELVKGNSNQEIADSLFISINTVKSHLIKIYSKLGVKNRTFAVQKIHELKLKRKS